MRNAYTSVHESQKKRNLITEEIEQCKKGNREEKGRSADNGCIEIKFRKDKVEYCLQMNMQKRRGTQQKYQPEYRV